MKIRCPYCGSPNDAVGEDLDSTATCSVCQMGLGRPTESRPPEPRLSYGQPSPDHLFDETDWGSKSTAIEVSPAGSLSSTAGIDSLLDSMGSALGNLPTAGEGVDISAILDESGTGILKADMSANDGPKGWRIRTARGIVYELGTTSEVSQRLADWTDLSQIKIARGLGPFMNVDSYEEFGQDLDEPRVQGADALVSQNISRPEMADFLVDVNPAVFSNTQSEITAPEVEQSDIAPKLDFERASERHGSGHDRTRQTIPSQAPLSRSVVSDATNSKVKARGFRTIAVVVFATMLAGVLLLEAPGTNINVKTHAAISTITPKVRAGIVSADRAMDAGNFTTAAQILERIARKSTNPQVYRRLAIALDRTNRPMEAGRALKMYRKYVGMEPNQ